MWDFVLMQCGRECRHEEPQGHRNSTKGLFVISHTSLVSWNHHSSEFLSHATLLWL